MPEQLLLLPTPQPRVHQYSLFLATFPDIQVAPQISEQGNSFRELHRLRGRLRPTEHLHVSLPFPAIDPRALKTMFTNIVLACAGVARVASPFENKFDQVMSLRGRPRNRPLVLVNGNPREDDGIMNLCRMLCAEFARFGLRTPSASSFLPHLTLLYDEREFASTPIAPISWRVNEIVLVFSEVGATKYHWCCSWGLGGHSFKRYLRPPNI